MKKRIISIIAIALAVIIAALTLVITLSQCDDGKKIVQVVVVPEEDNSSSDNTSSDDSTDDGNGYINENIGADLGYDSNDRLDLTEEFLENEDYKLISENGSEPLCKTFRGLTGTVYWPTEFTTDVFGRHYTDEMMEEELRRLVDAGITHVRTQIQTS